MDKHLLTSSEFAATARGAGTTSNILYFKGSKLFVACSGDSRAVMGQRVGGGITALDLSTDHKPDLPMERKRIESKGGVVSAAGPKGLPPSRVWVNGRVGLAMSRSLGDGEAKGHGVIPDPEIKTFDINPAADLQSDGHAFVIVASDGIWEFISSQQACELIDKHTSARAACQELVLLAEQRWKDEEGSYRDDITCIIAFLPFLKEGPVSDVTMAAASGGSSNGGAAVGNFVTKSDLGSGTTTFVDGEGDKEEGESFVKRRLSVAGSPIDFDA